MFFLVIFYLFSALWKEKYMLTIEIVQYNAFGIM